MNFSDIPVRVNNTEIDADWFNYLKLAGVATKTLLGGGIAETPFTLANGQGAPTDITGLVFDPATIGSFIADYRIYRNTTGAGATELAESGTIDGVFSPVAGTWNWTYKRLGDAGIAFSIVNATGQFQYTSSNITGTPDVSEIVFKARTIGA